ncbi:MAG: hypothetical protein HKN43_06110 [Rhodothermales bacterium]|nr:hypothetical protein [Rhodothermales bacterium]
MKITILTIALLSICLTGCTTAENTASADIITVEGRVNQRGNTPFQAWMIETSDRNSYILVWDAEGGQYSTSKNYRVTGRLYVDQWNGKDYAHLDVISIEDAM